MFVCVCVLTPTHTHNINNNNCWLLFIQLILKHSQTRRDSHCLEKNIILNSWFKICAKLIAQIRAFRDELSLFIYSSFCWSHTLSLTTSREVNQFQVGTWNWGSLLLPSSRESAIWRLPGCMRIEIVWRNGKNARRKRRHRLLPVELSRPNKLAPICNSEFNFLNDSNEATSASLVGPGSRQLRNTACTR